MASITIRRLDEAVKKRLRVRAASHGRSMEEEAREILKTGLQGPAVHRLNLAQSIRRHLDSVGGIDIAVLSREPVRRPPKLAG